ncbi:hypothetical protein FKP32DRAFT_969241 [Trametes sanguinea]|nr:hypothetical protein FKP32DRAFT_969241 [Trametes sanguinea]
MDGDVARVGPPRSLLLLSPSPSPALVTCIYPLSSARPSVPPPECLLAPLTAHHTPIAIHTHYSSRSRLTSPSRSSCNCTYLPRPSSSCISRAFPSLRCCCPCISFRSSSHTHHASSRLSVCCFIHSIGHVARMEFMAWFNLLTVHTSFGMTSCLLHLDRCMGRRPVR